MQTTRELAQNIEGLEWMNAVIPSHIPHNVDEVMCQQSKIYWLLLQLKNEMYHDQGGDLEKLKIVVGGDQLTRVNLQSAKKLRRGCVTQTKRLEHLHPIVVEMFHTLMDYIEKLFKRFNTSGYARDKGTMAHLKVLIQRSNINGQVKSRFEVDIGDLDKGMAYVSFGIVLFVWEFLPTSLVVMFFRVKKPNIQKQLLTSITSSSYNRPRFFFDNPRRYDNDDDIRQPGDGSEGTSPLPITSITEVDFLDDYFGSYTHRDMEGTSPPFKITHDPYLEAEIINDSFESNTIQ